LEHTFRPTRVKGPLRDVRVVKITSGCYHSVVLDEHKRVFSFGRNNHGQLGTGNVSDSNIPKHVSGLSLVRIESIAAGFYHTLCVAETQSGLKRNLSRPSTARSLSRDLRALLDDDTCSDVTFLVESRPIHAHRCIVMARCEPLRAMMQAPMRESAMCELEIQDVTYEAFKGLLEFIYTDQVQRLFDNDDDDSDGDDGKKEVHSNENQRSSSMSSAQEDKEEEEEESNSSTNNEEEIHHTSDDKILTESSKEEEEKEEERGSLEFALDLFSVADRFLVTELRDLCTEVILRGIRVENVSKIYSMADRRMLHDLRRKCLSFMMNNFAKVITTEQFSLMEPTLIQDILTEASRRGVFIRTLP